MLGAFLVHARLSQYRADCEAFTVDELSALVFRLDLSETADPLDPTAEQLRHEMVKEIAERDW